MWFAYERTQICHLFVSICIIIHLCAKINQKNVNTNINANTKNSDIQRKTWIYTNKKQWQWYEMIEKFAIIRTIGARMNYKGTKWTGNSVICCECLVFVLFV